MKNKKNGTSKSAQKRAAANAKRGPIERPPIGPTGDRRRRDAVAFFESNKKALVDRFFGDDAKCPKCGSANYGPVEPDDDNKLPPGILLKTKCEDCNDEQEHGLDDKLLGRLSATPKVQPTNEPEEGEGE